MNTTMHLRTIMPLLLALAWLISIPSAAVRAAEPPVQSLPAHLTESGIPTQGEVNTVEAWLKTVAAGQEGGQPPQPWFDHWLGGLALQLPL